MMEKEEVYRQLLTTGQDFSVNDQSTELQLPPSPFVVFLPPLPMLTCCQCIVDFLIVQGRGVGV